MSDTNGTAPFTGASETGLMQPSPQPAETPEPRKSAFPFWDALGGSERAGILPCGKCGKVHAEPLVAAFAHIHDALVRSAVLAGWDTGEDGTWCCPDCLDEPAASIALADDIAGGFAESIRVIYRDFDAAEQEVEAGYTVLWGRYDEAMAATGRQLRRRIDDISAKAVEAERSAA